jgi:hypothetical protein
MKYEFRFFYCPQIPDDLVDIKGELDNYDEHGKPVCDFFALIIDKTNPNDVKIVGRAKAAKVDPGLSQILLKDVCPVLKNKDKPKPNDIIVDIKSIDIYDGYQGQGLCTKLVKFCMEEIRKNHPEIRFFNIYNASFTSDGIPACKCYVKSGKEGGYDVYFVNYKNQNEKKKMSKEKCIGGNDMPRDYMYVMPKEAKKKVSPAKTKKRKRCPNGTRRNKKTGICEPKK